MGITRSSLLIWLIIVPSIPAGGMDKLPATTSDGSETSPQKPTFSCQLYCPDAIKKARKEGYRAAMQDSNDIIKSLDVQRQQILNKHLDALEKVEQAQEKLENMLRVTSVKDQQYAHLQDILVLLNKVCDLPK